MSLSEKNKNYCGIDLFKLIAALLIMLLHATENRNWFSQEIVFVATRFAVPFFFIASGFFFFNGLNKAVTPKNYFIKYEKKLLKLYFVWVFLIDLPFEVFNYIKLYNGSSPIKIALVIIRKLFIVGPGQFWYLLALLLSAAVIYLFHIKKQFKPLYCVVCGCIVLEIVYSCFRGLLSNLPLFSYFYKGFDFLYSWEFNFIMFGIPFMGIGYIIAKQSIAISLKYSIIGFLVSTIIRLLEYNLPILIPSQFLEKNCISVAFIFQAFFFFLMARDIPFRINIQRSLTIRQLSSFIYFSHLFFMYTVLDGILKLYNEQLIYEPWFVLPKVGLTLVPCVLLFTLIKKINNRHLNVLING